MREAPIGETFYKGSQMTWFDIEVNQAKGESSS
jgi:hypothetical protein